MMQENKELQLIDLCARLPYGVKCVFLGKIPEWFVSKYDGDESVKINFILSYDNFYSVVKELSIIKPYLRPMSSMTEEEFESLKEYSGLKYDQLDLASFQNGTYKCLDFYLNEIPSYVVIKVFDWLNKYHFDYRGLIEMGLAIEVTKENNPYE